MIVIAGHHLVEDWTRATAWSTPTVAFGRVPRIASAKAACRSARSGRWWSSPSTSTPAEHVSS